MTLVEIFQYLGDLGWSNVFVMLLLIILFTNLVVEGGKKFIDTLGLETKRSRIEREREDRIKKLEDKIIELESENEERKKEGQQFREDRVHDREQSHQIQDEWTEKINVVNVKQDKILERVDALAEQNRKYELADIRETLLQAYRYYTSPVTNNMQAWTEMEAHAFWEQYDNYKDRGGNGYMETVVKTEMNKLREIPLSDLEAISQLMESRHKKC